MNIITTAINLTEDKGDVEKNLTPEVVNEPTEKGGTMMDHLHHE